MREFQPGKTRQTDSIKPSWVPCPVAQQRPSVGFAHHQHDCRGQDLPEAWQQLPGRVPQNHQGLPGAQCASVTWAASKFYDVANSRVVGCEEVWDGFLWQVGGWLLQVWQTFQETDHGVVSGHLVIVCGLVCLSFIFLFLNNPLLVILLLLLLPHVDVADSLLMLFFFRGVIVCLIHVVIQAACGFKDWPSSFTSGSSASLSTKSAQHQVRTMWSSVLQLHVVLPPLSPALARTDNFDKRPCRSKVVLTNPMVVSWPDVARCTLMGLPDICVISFWVSGPTSADNVRDTRFWLKKTMSVQSMSASDSSRCQFSLHVVAGIELKSNQRSCADMFYLRSLLLQPMWVASTELHVSKQSAHWCHILKWWKDLSQLSMTALSVSVSVRLSEKFTLLNLYN